MINIHIPLIFALLGTVLFLSLVLLPQKDQSTATVIGDASKTLLAGAIGLATSSLNYEG